MVALVMAVLSPVKAALGGGDALVQARVNEILAEGGAPEVDVDAMARAVIAGDYGGDDERRRRLGSYCAAVQARVNELLA